MKKNTLITIGILAIAYAGIYFYQRYKRKQANEREASYDEALDAINQLSTE
jgi:hypothetical protein